MDTEKKISTAYGFGSTFLRIQGLMAGLVKGNQCLKGPDHKAFLLGGYIRRGLVD